MGEEETKRVDEQHQVSAEEKTLIPHHQLPPITHSDPGIRKKPNDRDGGLAEVEMEKRLALIKAWEDNEKTKADNKAYKRLCGVDAWENTKRASFEAQLKQIEEKIEKKKAEYGARMKNKMAIVHRAAEEKRATVEADRGKDFLTVDEAAAKFRATGTVPTKLFACFSC